jgi:DNA-binding protein HU-beta
MSPVYWRECDKNRLKSLFHIGYMNLNELLDAVRDKTGLPKKQIKVTLEAILDSIQDAVAEGDKVSLVGFGTFEPQERAERTGVNPKTGERLNIPATTVAKFNPGAHFKSRVAALK